MIVDCIVFTPDPSCFSLYTLPKNFICMLKVCRVALSTGKSREGVEFLGNHTYRSTFESGKDNSSSKYRVRELKYLGAVCKLQMLSSGC